MKILILVWNDISNKAFIDELRNFLPHEATWVYYQHRQSEKQKLDLEYELSNIKNLLKDNHYDLVIAKSLWCKILHMLMDDWYLIDANIILLWLPTQWWIENNISYDKIRPNFGKNCTIVQNEFDKVWSGKLITEIFADRVKNIYIAPENHTHEYKDYNLISQIIQSQTIK